MSNSYVDDINVKISEKYKPPCKISIPMSYSQRLTINKQMQDSRPNYDFHLEKYVLEKIKERKDFRKNSTEERKERLDLARKQFDEKIQQEKLNDELEKEKAQAKLLEEATTVETNTENLTHSTYPNAVNADQSQQTYSSNSTSQNQQNYVTKNGILMPIPVSSYLANSGNILQPIPMSNLTFEPTKPIKPFNLSDFESDTSSPFDNMELKSINDLEELAQVLKSDRSNYQPNMEYFHNTNTYQDPINYNNTTKNYNQLPSNTKSYSSNFPQTMTQPSRGYEQNVNDSMAYHPNSDVSQSSAHYNQIPNSYSQINTNFNPISTTFSQYSAPYRPQNTISYNPSTISNYSNLNGYYYNTPQVASQMQVAPTPSAYTPYVSSVTQPTIQRTSCKSVPDLLQSVERELDSTHLNDTSNISVRGQERIKNPFYTNTKVPIPTRPKSTDAVYSKAKVKDEMFNPFDRLSREQKEICRNVSVMGFPLDRVARVCLVFGSDQKKIVDHLLALSDLLDLGFSEKSASEALEKTDNNRDKALDILIS